VELQLDDEEARVLGALLEKEITTPEYYPLSLNALVNACNQKSNREPVVSYDEETVLQAVDRLRDKGLAVISSGRESRVTKYLQRFSEKFNFDRREIAVLCVLLLRGPQTPGELRGRTQRMYEFDDLDGVEATLSRLMEREPDALVKRLAKQPGTKESRYAHLFSGDVADVHAAGGAVTEHAPERHAGSEDRIMALEVEVRDLRQDVADLRAQFAEFRKQFE
jgi:uncharacterized protein YceH (UPF0502 family)